MAHYYPIYPDYADKQARDAYFQEWLARRDEFDLQEGKQAMGERRVCWYNAAGREFPDWRRGFFHMWAQTADDDGAGPVAVIEREDGTCDEYSPRYVSFALKRPGKA